MTRLLIVCLLAAAAFAQSGKLGPFTNSGDVGNPALKGSTEYNPATKQFRITGGGANMWANQDQFQYVWKEMSGNFAVSATLEFLGKGIDHRKAGIIVRQTLDTDSPYLDAIIHGNGMQGIQWRTTKGDITNGVDFPFDGPAKFQLKLVRQGGSFTVYTGKNGAPLTELGHTLVTLGNPLLVGIGVCSHNPDATDTVIFSDVSVEQLAPPPSKKK